MKKPTIFCRECEKEMESYRELSTACVCRDCRECEKEMESYGDLSTAWVCRDCKVVAEISYRKTYQVKPW